MQARVTVVMTVFDGMPYLAEAISSLQDQILKQFVCLLIDNGSGDETKMFLHSIADERFTIISMPETLPRTTVLNHALNEVTTEYVAILDADDIAAPDRLYQQVLFLDAHPKIVLVGGNVLYIDNKSKLIGKKTFPQAHEALVRHIPVSNPFAHSICCFRLADAVRAGGYPEHCTYAQDLALWVEMLRLDGNFASLPLFLGRVRKHEKQLSRDTTSAQQALRRKEDIQLSLEYANLPIVQDRRYKGAKQIALLRATVGLLQEKKIRQGCQTLWQAVILAPHLLLLNPVLWKHLFFSIKRGVYHLMHFT